jgi:uncharacterized membrane protein YedE/YeeE
MLALDTTAVLYALAGGALIGLAAGAMLLFNGRIAGIAGIFGGALVPRGGDLAWRVAFLAGLFAGGGLLYAFRPEALPIGHQTSIPLVIGAGLLVGFGTQLGGGCTSGHGVCGVGRLAPRSLVATMTFMAVGALTVFLHRVIA